jgi:hypothetical protein
MNNPRRMLYFLLLATIFPFTLSQPIHAEIKEPPSTKPDYTLISGEWQRTDGSYLLRVSDVQADGQAKVEYFNPSPIHVADNSILIQKKLIKLFIKFQDKGYEGSTYTLYYYQKKDALVGFYYQAPMDKTFEVIFMRKGSQHK